MTKTGTPVGEEEKDQDKKPELDMKALDEGLKKVLDYGPWRRKPKKTPTIDKNPAA